MSMVELILMSELICCVIQRTIDFKCSSKSLIMRINITYLLTTSGHNPHSPWCNPAPPSNPWPSGGTDRTPPSAVPPRGSFPEGSSTSLGEPPPRSLWRTLSPSRGPSGACEEYYTAGQRVFGAGWPAGRAWIYCFEFLTRSRSWKISLSRRHWQRRIVRQKFHLKNRDLFKGFTKRIFFIHKSRWTN